MAAPLFLTDRAHNDIDATCSWWSENRSTRQSERWYQHLISTIDRIRQHPTNYSLAPENENFPIKLRQVNFGLSGKYTHRIVFTIRPDMVLVLRIVHLASDALDADNLS